VGATIAVHGRPGSFAMGNNRDGLHFALCMPELVIPNAYDFVHGRRWRGKLLFGAVVVEYRVVVREQGVLDLDLCGEEMR
jgi:hypothetical protein